MAASTQTAIRVGDDITHSDALFGGIEGMLLGAAAGLLIGALLVGGTIVTGGALAVVVGATLLGGGLGGGLGKILGSHHSAGAKGKVLTGSPNVFIGYDKRPAARAKADVAHCNDHSDAEPAIEQPAILGKIIAQGSEHVLINGYYAARHGDKGICGFTLGDGWPTVVIGGPPKTVAGMTITSETASIDGLILGMTIVGGILLMVPAGAAIIAGSLEAGLGWGAIAGQLTVRLGGQLLMGAGLSTAGGMGFGYVGGRIWGQGSLGQNLSAFFGQVAVPFAGMAKIPGVGESAYGLIDDIPLFRGKAPTPAPTDCVGTGDTATGTGDAAAVPGDATGTGESVGPSEPVAPPEPAEPLPANPPEGRPATPAPEAESLEVGDTAAGTGEPAAPPEPPEPLPANEPEAALADPEPAPEISAPEDSPGEASARPTTRETGLSDRATEAIERLENIKADPVGEVNSEANHNHYSAARQEAMGKVVARRADGTPYSHIGDLQRASRGLNNVREALEAEIRNPPASLTERGLDVLLRRRSEVEAIQSRLRGFLNKIGHGQFPPFHTWPPGA